jgi:hypothetical protein
MILDTTKGRPSTISGREPALCCQQPTHKPRTHPNKCTDQIGTPEKGGYKYALKEKAHPNTQPTEQSRQTEGYRMSTRDASIESDEWEGLWEEDYDASLDDDDSGEGDEDSKSPLRTEAEPFAMVMKWPTKLLSPRGLQLYYFLSEASNNDTKDCFIRQATLAKYMNCNTQTIRRTIKELEAIGAIERTRRYKDKEEKIEISSSFLIKTRPLK